VSSSSLAVDFFLTNCIFSVISMIQCIIEEVVGEKVGLRYSKVEIMCTSLLQT